MVSDESDSTIKVFALSTYKSKYFNENLGRFRRGEPLLGAVDKALGY